MCGEPPLGAARRAVALDERSSREGRMGAPLCPADRRFMWVVSLARKAPRPRAPDRRVAVLADQDASRRDRQTAGRRLETRRNSWQSGRGYRDRGTRPQHRRDQRYSGHPVPAVEAQSSRPLTTSGGSQGQKPKWHSVFDPLQRNHFPTGPPGRLGSRTSSFRYASSPRLLHRPMSVARSWMVTKCP
jgi:hypothetical protein